MISTRSCTKEVAALHTPGPWERVPQSRGGDLIAQKYETGEQMNPVGLRLIAFMMARGDSLKEDEANARLIAAAPELLEACNALYTLIHDMGWSAPDNRYRSITMAAAAIGKAESVQVNSKGN